MVREARDKDRALAQGAPTDGAVEQNEDTLMEDAGADSGSRDDYASKLIILHVGSQNLRLGFGSDALPKAVPMVIARKWNESESEENDGEPSPKRQKVDGVIPAAAFPEKWFGDEVSNDLTRKLVKSLTCNSSVISIRPCALSFG